MKERFLFFKIKNWSDPESFGQLYDLYVKKIYRFVYFKVNSEVEAQDITSQTFLKAWQYLIDSDSDEIRNIRAFLYRIARNIVIDHFRTQNIQAQWQDNVEAMYANEPTEDLGEIVEKKLDKELVLASVNKLRPVYQEVILLKYVEDLSIGEIAKIINRSNGAARVLLHRAIQELKKTLNESL